MAETRTLRGNMSGVPSQVVNRLRLLLLAVVCWLCFVPTAHALRAPTPAESQLKEESALPEPSIRYVVCVVDGEMRIGLFVENDPINAVDPDGMHTTRYSPNYNKHPDAHDRFLQEIAETYATSWAEIAGSAAGGEALGAAALKYGPKVCQVVSHNRYFRLGKGWVPESGANEFRAAFGGRDKFIHGHIDSSNWYKPWKWFQKIGGWKNYD